MSGTNGRKKNNLLHGQKRLGSDSCPSETQNQEYRNWMTPHRLHYKEDIYICPARMVYITKLINCV